MRMVDLILKKREGEALSAAEIQWMIKGYVSGEIPDYQISALMMAIYFKGMESQETQELVRAMIHSGDVIDLSGINGIKVDKHSTGGVGDKTSIVLGPMVAATGVPVGKLSGRGLGHTGGTLDKLESFNGLKVEMSMADFIADVNRIGIAIAGQTANLVPADKKLYALRDVTGTVENVSLIAGSIMSKKLAAGCDAIVLDVKTGSGAFMKTVEESFELAKEMVKIGELMGKQTVAYVTDMSQPLGNAIGNALEVKEAIAALRGEGPEDLMELCLTLGSEMVVLGGKAKTLSEARKMLEESISSGSALQKLRELVQAQGGDPNQVDHPELLPNAKYSLELKAPKSAWISKLEALQVGHASMLLGAGRETKDSVIDMGAGILLKKKAGEQVVQDEVIAELFTNSEEKLATAAEELLAAFLFSDQVPKIDHLIFGRVD